MAPFAVDLHVGGGTFAAWHLLLHVSDDGEVISDAGDGMLPGAVITVKSVSRSGTVTISSMETRLWVFQV